jgi:hypothetical protein
MAGLIARILAGLRQRVAAFIASRFGQTVIGGFIYAYLERVIEWLGQALESEDIKQFMLEQLLSFIVEAAAERTGLVLNPADPLSKESISGAIGNRIGITLTDVTSKDAVLEDVGKYMATQINQVMQTNLDGLWPLDALPAKLADEVAVAVEKSARGQSSWISPQHVASLRTTLINFDKQYPPQDDKAIRRRILHRIAQRKYAAKMHRPYPWIPRTAERDPVIADLLKSL